jgi:tetratricopeptide (TPR) repeat protein
MDEPGRAEEAIAHFEASIRLQPDCPQAYNNLEIALSSTIGGRLPDAVAEYEAAVRIDPGYADAHSNLAAALAKMPGRESEATAQSRPLCG